MGDGVPFYGALEIVGLLLFLLLLLYCHFVTLHSTVRLELFNYSSVHRGKG